jgi:hypothetical protein
MRKTIAVLLLFLSFFAITLSIRFVTGVEAMPTGEGSCRAICGLTLLAGELFGDGIGKWVAGFLWLGAGIFLAHMARICLLHRNT